VESTPCIFVLKSMLSAMVPDQAPGRPIRADCWRTLLRRLLFQFWRLGRFLFRLVCMGLVAMPVNNERQLWNLSPFYPTVASSTGGISSKSLIMNYGAGEGNRTLVSIPP
jgi:hypothetical protein